MTVNMKVREYLYVRVRIEIRVRVKDTRPGIPPPRLESPSDVDLKSNRRFGCDLENSDGPSRNGVEECGLLRDSIRFGIKWVERPGKMRSKAKRYI